MSWPLVALLASTPASAQDLTVHEGWLIEPQAGTYYENGVGSPSVAYDRAADLWVMYFETRYEGSVGDCVKGRWGIGRATSPDGLVWTVDDALRIEPQDDTFFSCQAAHPTVIYDGTRWRMWFKAEQGNEACVDGVRPWGCTVVTGVGYAESTDGITFTVEPTPSLNLASFGYPTVVEVDGVLRMLLAYSNAANTIYELWESVSTDDGVTWSPPEFVVGPGFAEWVEDEIYNPALVCKNDEPLRYVLWAGGRNTEQPVGGPPEILTAALGLAYSSDGVSFPWDANNPRMLWDLQPEPPAEPDRDWRHWDVVRIGEDYLLYFSQFDDLDRNRIGLAYTYATPQERFAERRISDRICSTPEEQDTALDDTDVVDTDTDTDTDPETDETDTDETDTDTDTGGEPEPGCGCAMPGRASGALAASALVGLLTLRRRRR